MSDLGRREFLRGAGAVGSGLAVSAAIGSCDRDTRDPLTFFFGARPEEARVRMRVIEEFQRRYPDIAVRVEVSGPDALQQLLTYCAGGKCPDVIMAWELLYCGLAERGVLLDLNTMLQREPELAAELKRDCATELYETFAFHGAQYALPEQWSGVFLYYNKKLFDDAGIRPPPTRWRDAWTYADFLETATALTRRDDQGRVTQWGFVDAWVPYLSAATFGMNNGVDWFAPAIDSTHTNMADPRFIEGFQFYADLALRHRVAPSVTDQQSMTAPDLFTQGSAAMLMAGHWLYSEVAGADDLDFDVAVLPVGPHGGRGSRSDVGTTGLAIAAASPRREHAWEFVKFATGPIGQTLIADSGLFVPVLRSVAQSTRFADAHPQVRNISVLSGGLDNSRHLPVTPAWGEVSAVLDRQCNHVLRGAGSAEATFSTGLADDIDRLLRAV